MSWNFYPEEFSSYDEYVKYLKERGLALDTPERVYKEKIVMKYIDTKRLIAEIERLQKENSFIANHAFNSNMRNFYDGEVDCCKQLLSFINSLQQEQPEVDLEKEYKEYVEDDPVFRTFTNRIVGLAIARHFYELGLNTRKED